MIIEQFVMAYSVEQDRIRAFLPEGFESLRPVLRINSEIQKSNSPKDDEILYIELNTPVEAFGKRGWLNIGNWSTPATDISYKKEGNEIRFNCDFLEIIYAGIGIEGGCPAEKDNNGCFFINDKVEFIPSKKISSNKEFCDCRFKWEFDSDNAHGIMQGGKSIEANMTKPLQIYPKVQFTPAEAAKIECIQILGAYKVKYNI